MAWKSHLQGCQSNTLYSISPGIENHSFFLLKSVWLAYLGVYQKLESIIFTGIIIHNSWNCSSKYPNLKLHTQRKRRNYGKHRRGSLSNALFSVLVAVVCWLKIFKYNRKRCTQRNPQHGSQTRLPFWLGSHPVSQEENMGSAEVSVSGGLGTFFYLFFLICISVSIEQCPFCLSWHTHFWAA